MEDTCNALTTLCAKHVNESKERILNRKMGKDADLDDEISVLEKLILKSGTDSSIPTVMAFDIHDGSWY